MINHNNSRERVKKWRKNLEKRGGRTITVALEPKATKYFNALKKYYRNRKTQSEIINIAIEKLAEDIRDSIKKKREG